MKKRKKGNLGYLLIFFLLKLAPSVLLWSGPVFDPFKRNWERLLLDLYTDGYISIYFWLVALMGNCRIIQALPRFLKFKIAIGIASSWYARRGPINPDDVSKMKGSDVEMYITVLNTHYYIQDPAVTPQC